MIHHLSTYLLYCQYEQSAYITKSDYELQLATEWAQLEKQDRPSIFSNIMNLNLERVLEHKPTYRTINILEIFNNSEQKVLS